MLSVFHFLLQIKVKILEQVNHLEYLRFFTELQTELLWEYKSFYPAVKRKETYEQSLSVLYGGRHNVKVVKYTWVWLDDIKGWWEL